MMDMIRKVEFRADGILLLSILVFFMDLPMLAAVLGNVIIHECGHIFMLRRCGVYIRKISVRFTGLCIVCNLNFLSRHGRFFCAAAGPAVGICAAVLISFLGNLLGNDFLLLFAGVGVIFSVFNLLPVKPLDGGRMLEAAAPRVAGAVGSICGGVLLLLGLYVIACGYGTALACLAIFLLMRDEAS